MLNIKISIDDFPIIANMKKIEQKNKIIEILKTGYKIHFPDEKKIYNNNEYNDIIHKIEIIKNEITNTDMSNKITSLEQSLNKLIGLSSNSYKKGNFGECLLDDIISNRYGDIEYEKKGHIPHSGDAWLLLPDNKIIMLESKNYINTVNKDEIIKLQNDMINHHIKWGIMISFNSLIQGMKELDLHTFMHNNETYSIIMISNLGLDIHKLDLGLQIIRKLILKFDNIKEFPWIVQDINENLHELNNIIKKNYFLRDNYYTMEKDIQKILSNYYIVLREYQYELEKKVNEINYKISNTMKNSIELKNYNDDDIEKKSNILINNLINEYREKKIYSLLERIIDFIKKKKWNIIIDNNNDILLINYEKIEIGKIKFQIKKIIINIFKFDILINLNLGKDNENKYLINILNMIT
jgi:hypothetical protein|uniref:Uncharacterized protein n=1 Tax=viral metagenome TaxID=1070528 RepID=A0A6C0ED09_9ZZZZ